MNWIEANMVQLMYWLDIVGQMLPLVLTAAVIFTFFIVHGYGRKLTRMEFYLDRIDNHLREITFFIKEYQARESAEEQSKPAAGTGGKISAADNKEDQR